MSAPDLLALRYGFYKLVYITPTRFCPSRCRHCCIDAGPEQTLTASADELRRWVRSVGDAGPVEWLGIQGGEPFAIVDELRAMLEAARDAKLPAAVVTNGGWATSPRAARDVLGSLPRISLLVVSADEFHEEFVPLRSVRHALEAGLACAERTEMQICEGPGHAAFMARLEEAVGRDLLSQAPITLAELGCTGRAAASGVASPPERTEEWPQGRCLFLGTPVIREDGTFVACCQPDVVTGDGPSPLRLGRMSDGSVARFLEQVDRDVYLQTLRVYGPRAVAVEASAHDWGWAPRRYARGIVCDLCRHLAACPGVFRAFRERHDNAEYRRELALARLAAYGETAPLDAEDWSAPA